EWTLASTVDGFFLEKEIQDGQLRMMFSCCHPKLSREAQSTLILKILCGFSVSEIAHAFLMSEAAVEKSLSRAKSVLKESGTLFDVAGEGAIHKRIDAVLQALY